MKLIVNIQGGNAYGTAASTFGAKQAAAMEALKALQVEAEALASKKAAGEEAGAARRRATSSSGTRGQR